MPHIFTLPGWQGSSLVHWQMRWADVFGDHVVEQHDWLQPLRGDWITRLEDMVQAQRSNNPKRPIAFVAHSLGCHLLASWAALSPHVQQVAAALLVAPPDLARADLPPQLHSWRQPVRHQLPFPSVVVASSDDPFASLAASAELAQQWGADLVNVGARGHINAESGLGDWPQGRALLIATIKTRPVRAEPVEAKFKHIDKLNANGKQQK